MKYSLQSITILFLCLSWTAGQSFYEENKGRLDGLFGTPPPPTSDQEEDRRHIQNLFGKPTATTGGRHGSPTDSTACGAAGRQGKCVAAGQCSNDILRPSTCNDQQVCCLEKEKPTPRVLKGQCGYSNPELDTAPRALSDTPPPTDEYSRFGEFPWMVALLLRSGSTVWSQSDYLGGGSLIHPSVVMTVAHKVNGRQPTELKCRAGESDTQTEDEVYAHQERNVMKIVQHAGYYRISVYNSIALLILETPFEFDDAPHIGVACVMPQPPPTGTLCFSMGWGKDFVKSQKYSDKLKKVQLPMVDRGVCEKRLHTTYLGRYFELHPSLSCAGGNVNDDTCVGDGGSPLVCPIGVVLPGKQPTRFAIAGMVAWGLGCGSDLPGVYVNVPHLHGWLAQRMREEGFGPDSYTY